MNFDKFDRLARFHQCNLKIYCDRCLVEGKYHLAVQNCETKSRWIKSIDFRITPSRIILLLFLFSFILFFIYIYFFLYCLIYVIPYYFFFNFNLYYSCYDTCCYCNIYFYHCCVFFSLFFSYCTEKNSNLHVVIIILE